MYVIYDQHEDTHEWEPRGEDLPCQGAAPRGSLVADAVLISYGSPRSTDSQGRRLVPTTVVHDQATSPSVLLC
jgi:hypothetical protein